MNTGTGDAEDVTLTSITCRVLAGMGASSVTSPTLPLALGRLAAGENLAIPIEFFINPEVKKCALSETGTLLTSSLKKASFSSSQVFYLKPR